MEPIGLSEMSVNDYKSTLRNNPEERRCHLHRGGSLQWRRPLSEFELLRRVLGHPRLEYEMSQADTVEPTILAE
jgi:hypothetical protein